MNSVAIRACTFPARPINGGSLELALPKTGTWFYEPKYNGWRALVHAPTGAMFNRFGQRLTIASEFIAALSIIRQARIVNEMGLIEWFDCEALERRHGLGRGTLLVFDYIEPAGEREQYHVRKQKLIEALTQHDFSSPPAAESVYSVPPFSLENISPLDLYDRLKELNLRWRCPFYEGVVAKRADSPYQVQLRSPGVEFASWVKHRWA